MGRALMIQGTASSVGKSFLVTALCRCFARRGIRVVPFKAQNISNNARVVEGGEIGTAQFLQALAARTMPDVRMNPILIKPEAHGKSQVVVWGKPDLTLSRVPWRKRSPHLWDHIKQALDELLATSDLVLIEGAGSPAEINLSDADLANMRVASAAQAPVLLVADMDRGGAIAALYGTWALLAPQERCFIKGFIFNKLRGSSRHLEPAPRQLKARTGVPVVGIVPYREQALPEEDAASLEQKRPRASADFTVAVVRYPLISNFDEFKPLERLSGVHLVWVVRPEDLAGADLVVLPGSKHVVSDLAWLKAGKFALSLLRHLQEEKPILGICGGLQMLGGKLSDPHGIEGAGQGLGLLPLETVYVTQKAQRLTEATIDKAEGFWAPLSGLRVRGYEIHHGRSHPAGDVREVLPGGLGFQKGQILGLYLHGFFENEQVLQALFGQNGPGLEPTFESMATLVEQSLDMAYLEKLIDGESS